MTDNRSVPAADEATGLARLAAAARDGDVVSHERLLAAARPLLVRWARRLVEDPAAAEDVAQDALVEIHRTLGTLREPGALAAWLYLVVRKHADRHRRSRRPGLLLDLDLEWPAAPGCDPEPEAQRAEERAVIRRALALAADADRLLLVLRYYGGWPQADIAALLGITSGAVRKRLHDARRRLAAGLESAVPAAPALDDPWETMMSDVRSLLGASYHPGDPMPGLPPGRPPLSRPARPGRLPTGIKVIDALVPLPRGGVTDLTGQAGTGHLALLAEILHNLAAAGPAALVAVGSPPPSAGLSARLWKLLEPPAPSAALTAVISAPPGREDEAAGLAARLAAWLAHGNATVLLAADEPTARQAGPDVFSAVGTDATGPGSVTGLRVAPNAAGAAPAAPWPGADAELRTAAAEMVAGRLPAVDVLASRSALLDSDALPAGDRAAARRAREVLTRAARVRDYLTQPLRIAEPATGVPGQAVPADEAVAGLARLLGQPG